jgi:tetratricopeptide (TPR) repeat protein
MSIRFAPFALTAAAVFAVAPVAVLAQTSVFYVPPKLLKNGTSTTPIAGAGSVTVKVLVKHTGLIDPASVTVVKSTNHGDDTAAIEVVKSSTYKPARRDGKPSDGYYTYVIKFTANGTDTSDDSTSADLRPALADLRAGKYADAKTTAQAYLQTHAGDTSAYQLLGVANAFLNDNTGAAKAFSQAGTIDNKYKQLALGAYNAAAADALKAGDNESAIAFATKGLAMTPTAQAYNVRGTAEFNSKKYDVAVADLEKSRDMALASKSDTHQAAIIMTNLAVAYFANGQEDKGLATAKDVEKLDPSLVEINDAVANHYFEKGQAADKAGKSEDAVADFEAGAAATPKYAVRLYTQAAITIGNEAKPDWKKMKAEADKALAIDPSDATANYAAGVALANDKDPKGALVYLNKAKASVNPDKQSALATRIADAIKALGGGK